MYVKITIAVRLVDDFKGGGGISVVRETTGRSDYNGGRLGFEMSSFHARFSPDTHVSRPVRSVRERNVHKRCPKTTRKLRLYDANVENTRTRHCRPEITVVYEHVCTFAAPSELFENRRAPKNSYNIISGCRPVLFLIASRVSKMFVSSTFERTLFVRLLEFNANNMIPIER